LEGVWSELVDGENLRILSFLIIDHWFSRKLEGAPTKTIPFHIRQSTTQTQLFLQTQIKFSLGKKIDQQKKNSKDICKLNYNFINQSKLFFKLKYNKSNY
jgi:hypothetical protein